MKKASLIILFVGLLVLLYPVISNYIATKQQENVIVGYDKRIAEFDKEQLEEEWKRAVSYNENPTNYMNVLNLEGNGVMGYIKIPKIDISIPIYHYASEASLKKGIGHMEQTGLPIGGNGNHPVLTGHRGLPNAELFTRLDELKIGDYFYIHVLDKVLVYQVNQITIVLPEEAGKIRPLEYEDLVTLVTCTPYGVNTHRLLVQGERAEYPEEIIIEEVEITKRNKNIIILIILFTGMIVMLYPHMTHKSFCRNVQRKKVIFIKNQSRLEEKSEKLLKELQRRNEKLYEEGQKNFKSQESYEKTNLNLKMYGIRNNTIGFISIPKMKIELPILLGASEENMKQGAVHLTETSYPIGGINTNCVIAAHRGYAKTAMFRDIQKLEAGDKVYIRNFKEKLTYKVTELRIISPTDINKILIQEGKDMVTLITCHPYRKNSQRYIVFCERI